MSTKKTENLGLHAWERTDVFSMDEFNENFDAIDKAVAAKAEQTALDTLAGRVDKKTEQTDLDAETAARETAIAALAGQVDKKADQTALAALAGRVGALETGQLVWKYDSYTGTGEVGSKTPCRLEFDFKPLMLLIVSSSSSSYGGFPWLRGMVSAHAYLDSYGGLANMRLTWEDRAVQWYSSRSGAESGDQLNNKNVTYCYLVLGIVE